MWPTGTVPTAWTTPRNLSLPAIALVAFFWTVPAITFLYRHTRDDILSKYIYIKYTSFNRIPFLSKETHCFSTRERKEERNKGEREREKKKKMNWWILKNGSRSKPRLERLDRVTTSIPRFQGEGRGIKKGGRRRRRRESRRSWFTNRGRTSVGDPTRVGSLTTRRISKFRYLGGPIASPGSKEPGSVTLYSGRASIAFVTPITHSLLFEPNSFTVRDFNILFLLIVTFLIALD